VKKPPLQDKPCVSASLREPKQVNARPALVPKLRFPEFRGAEEWEKAILGNLSEVARGGSPRPIDGFLTTAAEGLNWLKIGDVDKEAKFVTRTAEKVRQEALRKTRVVNPGDLILSNSMSFGRPYILQIKTCIHDGWIAITDIAKKANRDFLYYSISAPNSQSYFIDNAAGSGVQNLNADIIKALPVCFPATSEQQKIAECLSSVDEVIAAQAGKVDALKTHKNALMQQLFPREGETQPRLRFAEFQNAGEWVQKTVGDVSEVLMCKRIFAEETNPNEGVPFYKIGTLGGVPDAFISQEKFEDYKSRYNYPRTGEVLITCSGTVGKCLPFDGKDAYFQDSNIVWLDNPTGEVSNEFLLMILSNVNWGKLNSTTITRIYGPDLRGRAIKYPEDEAEQKRIGTCLSSLEALITAATQKLEALKRHKRGLMQQLFPSSEEPAG
jgi:type I restriction enzyme S subunit